MSVREEAREEEERGEKTIGKQVFFFLELTVFRFYLLGSSGGSGGGALLGKTCNTGLGLPDVGRLRDGLLHLSENNLHVAWVGHEGVDATVSAVQATADLGGGVDLDVADLQQVGVQILEDCVRLGVLEEVQKELAGLLGPAGERARQVGVLLSLGGTANTSDGATERDGVSVVQHTLEESLSLSELHAADGVGSGVGVLEVDTQVGALSLGRCDSQAITITNKTMTMTTIIHQQTILSDTPSRPHNQATESSISIHFFQTAFFFQTLHVLFAGLAGAA